MFSRDPWFRQATFPLLLVCAACADDRDDLRLCHQRAQALLAPENEERAARDLQRLVGYFDLVTRDAEGTLAVVDIKTASRRYTQQHVDQDLQATCYCYAVSHRTSEEAVLFCWDVLLKTKAPKRERYYTRRNADDFERMVWLVRTMDRAIQSGVFIPNSESYFCASCGFRTACQEWHRKSSRRVIEMGRAS